MKRLLTLLIIFIFVGCKNETHRKFGIVITNGTGFNYSRSEIECDSFQMYGNKKAIIWVDGVEMNIESDNHITPYNY